MKETKTSEEKYIEELVRLFGRSDYVLLNTETGEIKDLPNGSITTMPKLPKLNKNGQQLTTFMNKEKFVKLYKRTLNELSKVLSYRDFTWFIRMSEYLGMQDCVLYDDNGEYLNIKKLSKLLDVDYNNFSVAFKNFEQNELVKKIKFPSQKDVYKDTTVIVANPYLYMNGEYILNKVKMEFYNTKWEKMYRN